MATSGAMADFARMPTSRKVLVFVVIGFLAGFLYFRLVFKSLPDLAAEDFAKLTQRFGVEVIAEKIEDERQAIDVLELDITYGQGHLFGEPRAIKDSVLAEAGTPAPLARPERRAAAG